MRRAGLSPARRCHLGQEQPAEHGQWSAPSPATRSSPAHALTVEAAVQNQAIFIPSVVPVNEARLPESDASVRIRHHPTSHHDTLVTHQGPDSESAHATVLLRRGRSTPRSDGSRQSWRRRVACRSLRIGTDTRWQHTPCASGKSSRSEISDRVPGRHRPLAALIIVDAL